MHPVRTSAILLAVLTLTGATVAIAGEGKGKKGRHGKVATATLVNAAGAGVGHAWFRERHDSVWVFATVRDLPAGFHGFHVHTTGACTGDFTSVGGHLNQAGATHPAHAGDLPTLSSTPTEPASWRP